MSQAQLPLTKQSLRTSMLEVLKQGSPSSEGLVARLKSFLFSWKAHASLTTHWGIFYPLTLEPQILSLLQDQDFAHYAWCWPICFKDGRLKFYHWSKEHLQGLLHESEKFRSFLRGSYEKVGEVAGLMHSLYLEETETSKPQEGLVAGIREGWVQAQKIQGVLVPALAIDTQGYRLGRGGGYYDRFLAHYEGVKVAVVFDCQLLPQVPRDPWDQPVDWVVTEKATYWRGPKGLQADEEKRWKQ